jgi:non-lysosomal glucosylceramidase
MSESFLYVIEADKLLYFCRTAKDNPPVTFAVAACETQNVNVTVLPVFDLSGENHVSAKEMWNTMLQVITSTLSEHLVYMIFHTICSMTFS